MKQEYKTIRIKISIKLWKQLAKQAIDKDMALSTFITELLKSHLGKEGKMVKEVKKIKVQEGKRGKNVKEVKR